MALATQCPHCKTTFKVAHDQLKLRSGLVRCGACKQIFNGIEHLVPPEQPAASPTTPPSPPAPVDAPPKADSTLVAAAEIAAGKLAAVQDVAPSAIDTLEFIPVDDPETQTRILSSSAEPDATSLPQAIPPTSDTEVDDDPLTRMTLVDFSLFNEEWDAEEAPPKSAPAGKPQASEDSIWPDTQDGLHEAQEFPGDVVSVVSDTLPPNASGSAEAADESDQDISTEEHAAIADQDALSAVTEPVSVTASAEDDGDRFSDTVVPASLVEEESADDDEPTFVRKGRRRQRWGRMARVFMALASILLLVAALGQTAYAFRDQLAARFPSSKPALVALCELAGCQVSLPAQIDQVSIESNELQAHANNKNIFTLSLLLHNRSAVAQAWPHVELTLNDKNGKPLVRRTLGPRDYLPSDRLLPQGIAAGSEQSVAVSFELSQLQASDYRVYLFYP
ncbi:DUF3426 domain-containing protein [Janthinobacterium sp. 17J80-10]|uniref:DUF3426 domain-containing protein n=1 Tax=Janthinobacterium sp. 17J80-10 TaxID=2497863 RepID=UPI0010059E23|nr:DUF3426 domain-containing protein [Janthinobacterium sp. 17J80-10]QAU33525.1 DUF3426 domain-containing protein [Janthinobacterium sp. 17J80-10]